MLEIKLPATALDKLSANTIAKSKVSTLEYLKRFPPVNMVNQYLEYLEYHGIGRVVFDLNQRKFSL